MGQVCPFQRLLSGQVSSYAKCVCARLKTLYILWFEHIFVRLVSLIVPILKIAFHTESIAYAKVFSGIVSRGIARNCSNRLRRIIFGEFFSGG